MAKGPNPGELRDRERNGEWGGGGRLGWVTWAEARKQSEMSLLPETSRHGSCDRAPASAPRLRWIPAHFHPVFTRIHHKRPEQETAPGKVIQQESPAPLSPPFLSFQVQCINKNNNACEANMELALSFFFLFFLYFFCSLIR